MLYYDQEDGGNIEHFHNLDIDKQEKILEAAFNEFSTHGFVKASTNRIAKEAGIGKGTLFYYFHSKADLYRYLTDYGIKFMEDYYINQIDEKNGDYIEKLRRAGTLKMKAYYHKPYVFKFAAAFFFGNDEYVNNKINSFRAIIYKKLYSNIDRSLFRKDFDSETVFTMLQCSITGYEQKLISELDNKEDIVDNLEDMCNKFYDYLDSLKKVFYE